MGQAVGCSSPPRVTSYGVFHSQILPLVAAQGMQDSFVRETSQSKQCCFFNNNASDGIAVIK